MQGGNLARVIIILITRSTSNAQADRYAFHHCMGVRVMLELKHGPAETAAQTVPKQPASPGTQAAPGLVAEGGHIVLRAGVGRTMKRRPLLVPSCNGKLVAPDPGEERCISGNPSVIRAPFFERSRMELHACTDAACYKKNRPPCHINVCMGPTSTNKC